MADNDFRLDTRYSGRPNPYVRPAAVAFAVVAIVIIILTMTTSLASRVLPMEDQYFVALIPQAPDGAEPLALRSIDHMETDTMLTVSGTVFNRTAFTITGLQAVIDIHDKFGFTTQSASIPLEPKDVPAQAAATFQSTIMLKNPLAGFAVRFQLMDGPFVPHKDERAPAVVPPTALPGQAPKPRDFENQTGPIKLN
jgi:hypothetical protein